VEPVHEAVPQLTEVEACVQAPAPLHTPVLPQGGLGVQPLSAVPAATLAHDPALAPTLQAWQVAHAPTPQQTPSVQNPEPHSLDDPQATPLPFLGTQLPPAPVQ
jgi:hypothetical protein